MLILAQRYYRPSSRRYGPLKRDKDINCFPIFSVAMMLRIGLLLSTSFLVDATWSILVMDQVTKQIGVAMATCLNYEFFPDNAQTFFGFWFYCSALSWGYSSTSFHSKRHRAGEYRWKTSLVQRQFGSRHHCCHDHSGSRSGTNHFTSPWCIGTGSGLRSA